jgi:alkylhydroperoxidase family enzyme
VANEWRAFGDLDAAQLTALGFAEQFTVDVAAIGDEQRSALVRALGDDAVAFTHAVHVADVVPRTRFALDRLFGASPPAPSPPAPTPAADTAAGGAASLWDRIEDLIRVVPGLQALDPVTTELVRLRGARQHRCRICQSLRSRSAIASGADDATFDAVDHYADSDLSDARKAALAFTDAFIWTPGRLTDDVVGEVRRHYSDGQQVELVLDITRNATNKPAVSMAVDAANVTDGYEIYDVAADGSITYGLSRP